MPKKKKNKKPKFEIDEDLKEYAIPQLEEDLKLNVTQIEQLQIKRNYIQMDRDMVEKFFLNTRAEREEVDRKVVNEEAKAQQLEQKHKMEIKYYRQKIKHMEFDQEESNIEIEEKGTKAKSREDEDYRIRKVRMTQQKKELKTDIGDTEIKQIAEIKKKQGELNQIMEDTHQLLFEDKIVRLIQGYEETLKELRAELALKRKVQIHEIEERKNQHINDLLRNHDQAFKELKAYYNDITEDNLKLIKDLKADIDGLNERINKNTKNLNQFLHPNHELENQLKDT
jgi:growth arrest-specific protein 8